MAAGKTSGYRHNARPETILSQVPKALPGYGKGAETIRRWAGLIKASA